MTLTQPLKWHGGKYYLAKRIIEEFPTHVHYVEPYFGGGSVLLQKPTEWIEGHSEVVNDINGELMNFWRVLQSPEHFEELKKRVELTPFSQGVWCDTEEQRNPSPRIILHGEYAIDYAVAFFVCYRQSRQGLGKDFATLTRNRVRRGMNEQVSSWLTAIEGLPEVHERLKRVVILNDDALKVIKQQDGPNTLFYLDPPYLHETRSGQGANNDYQYEMTYQQHDRLLETLHECKGSFILSGYRSELYDDWKDTCNWRRVSIKIDNKASAKKTKDIKTECLWMNY